MEESRKDCELLREEKLCRQKELKQVLKSGLTLPPIGVHACIIMRFQSIEVCSKSAK